METVVIVIHLMVVVALVTVVLLQKSEGGALGIGGGGGGGFMTGRGTANVLTRVTTILAALFFLTSITLTLLARSSGEIPSIFDTAPPSSTGAPAGETSDQGTSGQETGDQSGGSVLDQIQQLEQQEQSSPQAPQSQ
jgi:preprotein translocase subunit SecG